MPAIECEQDVRRASELLKAMGNERRLMVLCNLLPGEKSVGELEELVGLSQSALSQHLARLRRDGLVKSRRDAQRILYSLAGPETMTLLETIHNLFGPAMDNEGAPVRWVSNA